jgi:hypothetical protein
MCFSPQDALMMQAVSVFVWISSRMHTHAPLGCLQQWHCIMFVWAHQTICHMRLPLQSVFN